MDRRFSLALLGFLLVVLTPLLMPGVALGHAGLERADPAPNSTIARVPSRVRIWFTEPLEAKFSGIQVYDASHRRVDLNDFRVEGDRFRASIGLKQLSNGTYTVNWHNLSAEDGHSVSGAFAFGVGTAPLNVGGTAGAPAPTSQSGVPVVPSALIRALNFVAMAVVVGAFAFRSLVLRPALKVYARSITPAPAVANGERRDEPARSDPSGAVKRRGKRRRNAAAGPDHLGNAPQSMVATSMIENPVVAAAQEPGADASPQRLAGLESAVTARLLVIIGVGLSALILASIAALALQAIVASQQSLLSALGAPLGQLLGTRYGVVWLARMGVVGALAALLWAPRSLWRSGWPWLVGAVLGTCVLLTTSLISHGAASGEAETPLIAHLLSMSSVGGHLLHVTLLMAGVVAFFITTRPEASRPWPWLMLALLPLAVLLATSLPVALDWLHLVAMSLWIGGLVALTLAAAPALGTLDPPERRSFVAALIPGFSRLALSCVAALVVTGFYAAWIHVRHVAALTGTSYGLSLVAKTALVLPLIALGAANLYLGSQRLRGLARRMGVSGFPVHLSRRFFRTVRLELVLAALVLIASGVLTSVSPPFDPASATSNAAFSETRATGQGDITLSADPAIAGPNVVDVLLEDGGRPVTDASKVTVRFSLPSQNVGESEAVAQPSSNGAYRLTGPYMGVPGDWTVEVVARRPGHDDARSVFTVPVVAPRVVSRDNIRFELRTVPVKPSAGEGTKLKLLVTDLAGKPAPAQSVSLVMLMPQHAYYEEVALRDEGDGAYTGETPLAMSGEWLAESSVKRPGHPALDVNIQLEVVDGAGNSTSHH